MSVSLLGGRTIRHGVTPVTKVALLRIIREAGYEPRITPRSRGNAHICFEAWGEDVDLAYDVLYADYEMSICKELNEEEIKLAETIVLRAAGSSNMSRLSVRKEGDRMFLVTTAHFLIFSQEQFEACFPILLEDLIVTGHWVMSDLSREREKWLTALFASQSGVMENSVPS